MKVTVCFGHLRVVVPCGSGELLIRDLIHESIRRYIKASGKDSGLVVHHLQSQSGILDPDDRVCDVADDRERIVASFENSHVPDSCLPQGGDGASGSSSVGTGSPDIFKVHAENKYKHENLLHIEVTRPSVSDQLSLGLGLQVRRDSEPSLNHIGMNEHPYLSSNLTSDPTKRWSAAPVCRSDNESSEAMLINGHNKKYISPEWSIEECDVEETHNEPSKNFSRSGRLSMQFLGDGAGYRWMDAAEKNFINPSNYGSKSLPRELKRKEPIGQAYESIEEKEGEMLLIVNEQGGPLGLTAIPDIVHGGLIVQAVEPDSRAEKGLLKRGDRILEINGIKLVGLSENSIQNHLRKSLSAQELRLFVVRTDKQKRWNKVQEIIHVGEMSTVSKIATVSPNRKMHSTLAGAASSLQVANTRKPGKRIEIALRKGLHGLGFSVTTRDNPAGGDCPIYIKNVLPRGAAIEDGRLKPGDRLLEVDDTPMTGKSQTDVVGILRSTNSGATVRIVVSRQRELTETDEKKIGCEILNEHESAPPKPPPPVLPRKSILNENAYKENDMRNNMVSLIENNSLTPWKNKEVLTFHIPVHDTEKAGLGVSVKGKTGSNISSENNSILKQDGDLGIFIKSVINGGAASRDGRLKMNDQLLSVNEISLLGQSNAEAMETLRKAMLHTGGNFPGMITLSIARRTLRSNSSSDQLDTDNSNNSDNSGTTVIYLNSENNNDCKNVIFYDKKNIFTENKRWSNPVLDRLTGRTGNTSNSGPQPLMTEGLRNESYYMATNSNWSPQTIPKTNSNNSVLIEEDTGPSSLSSNFNSTAKQTLTSTPRDDTEYSSQLSLDINSPVDAFSRDAIGRRSISEKHHAALDAKETGTYQRNKKLREVRDTEKRGAVFAGSVESLSRGIENKNEFYSEERDFVSELGPSLGLKKSSSLESLQTMVQEIQMSDELRGPNALRTPRGRGREGSLRSAVESPPESQPQKHWLLEEGGLLSRHGPFQSSLNDGKMKNRQKKPSILKGIGHMFRFGKHRKDVVAPTETLSDFGGVIRGNDVIKLQPFPQSLQNQFSHSPLHTQNNIYLCNERLHGPPMYQPPPPVSNVGINKRDVFNHRYSHYVNYDELKQQINLSHSEHLSESTLDQMRRQVLHQRNKVEEDSRRQHHYHSQRSSRNDSHYQQRPVSSYYEYETLPLGGLQCKTSTSSIASKQWGTNSIRNRNQIVNQVCDPHPASQV